MNDHHVLTVAGSERDSQVASLKQAVAERDSQIASLKQAVAERDNQIASLSQTIADARRELAQVLASKSWRITKPLRFSRRVAVSKPYITTWRALSDNSRALWRALPISYESKRTLKGLLFKTCPWIFRWSKAYQAWNAFNAPVNYSPMINAQDRLSGKTRGEYVPLIKASPLEQKPAKLICFYLPQFHAIPENDEWWGKGFTEWTNVQPAQPQFAGHHQPHVPGELGYYNLLDPTVQRRQVELAKLYGIEGFCFYFYWFGGKRLLEAPIENYLNDKTLDLPFCLCWANENWSRRWDGLDSEILMAQQHSVEDDLAFVQHVARYMRDPRYIRINGKPLLLVYRPSLLPSAQKTASRWRDWCRANGIGEIYLAYTQSFETVDPVKYGFDAAIEFPPNNSAPPNITGSVTPIGEDFGSTVYDWRVFVERSENYKQPPYTLFRSVCPSWDNTARRKNRGTVFFNSTPTLYQRWLENAIRDTQAHRSNPDERLIFVNAWNEWAEGAHLEPDARYGYAHLNATLRALLACGGSDACASVTEETTSRHKSVLDVHWNRVSAHFVEAPERGLYEYLCDYVVLLAQASQHGASFSLVNHVPYCEINGEKIVLDRRESLSRLGSSFNHKRVFCFVILQYNKVELTEQCVASLRKLDDTGRDVRVVIVDNKSSDEVRARTQEAFGSAPDVTVLYLDANLGFSGGNNLGYEYAREKLGAEFMVILNNDTVIEQGDFIREAVELYGHWGFSIAGPDIITPDGRHENPWNDYVYSIEEWETLRSIRCQEREHYLGHSDATFRKIGKATPVSEILLNPILQGAAYVVSPIFITDHDKIFDERLFLYGEEFLLAIDCLLSGHLTIYTNKLEVRHHEGATTGDLPSHDKLMFGYDSVIKAISLSLKRLERHREASIGSVIDFADIEKIEDCLDHNVPNVLVDLLFCQPGYHGGGEYGKAVFKALAESNIKHGGFQLWAALNPNLFIDPWVWETCKSNAINIVAVSYYDEIVQIVNSERFDSFFTPAIVVYTGYEYMGKVGSHLPFTCEKTRVIGTLHDIRDFELACNRRQILETRRSIGCLKESKMSESEINRAAQTSLDQAEALRRMYRAIIKDETVDTIVTISSYCENSIKSNIGSPRKPLKVLASPQKRRPSPEPFVSDKFNLTTSPYALLLHAAREEKNGASAVVAFDQLFEESNNHGLLGDFHVVLTGVTHLDQLGLAQIRHPDRFITLSELAPGQFEYLLKHARFLVYPSFNEGFGYPPIEVMTYGVPSIVSNATAIPEVCGQAVKYFDPYNLVSIKEAILNILSDGIERNVIFEQYNSVTEKQNADLEILVGLIVGKNSEKEVPPESIDHSDRPDRTLYFHTGTKKTGSSALQAYLAANETRLGESGVSYLFGDKRYMSSGSVGSQFGNAEKLVERIHHGSMTDVQVAKLLESYFAGRNTAICSSENFASLNTQAWQQIKNVCQHLRIRTKFITFVRDIGPFYYSLYGQLIKGHGLTESFDEFCLHDRYKFILESLKCLLDLFGKESMSVIHYESVADHIDVAFMGAIGLDPDRYDNSPLARTINRSLTEYEQDIISNFNQSSGQEYGRELSQHLMDKFPYLRPAKKMSHEAIDTISKRHVADVNWLNQTFFDGAELVVINKSTESENVQNALSMEDKLAIDRDVTNWCITKLQSAQDENIKYVADKLLTTNIDRELANNPAIPENFDPVVYLLRNPDVLKSGISPYLHFISSGQHENRRWEWPNW